MSRDRDPRAHWLDDDPFDKKTLVGPLVDEGSPSITSMRA